MTCKEIFWELVRHFLLHAVNNTEIFERQFGMSTTGKLSPKEKKV